MKWVAILYFQTVEDAAGHKGQETGTLVHGELVDSVAAE